MEEFSILQIGKHTGCSTKYAESTFSLELFQPNNYQFLQYKQTRKFENKILQSLKAVEYTKVKCPRNSK